MDVRRVLDPAGLQQLTETWELWVDEAATPGRKLTRLRLHLFFLLARFGGLRLVEISNFCPGQLDLATGYLQAGGRAIFLPVGAMRALRRILTLEEASAPEFVRLDPGFLRRAFYAVAELAGLPPALCAPRALRYARAYELLSLRIPLEFVAKALGFRDPLHLAALINLPDSVHGAGSDSLSNKLTGLILELETGPRSARLFIELAYGLHLHCISPLEELLAIEPKSGRIVEIYIPPACIFPAAAFPECENLFDCRLLELAKERFEARLQLALNSHLNLLAIMNPSATDFTICKPGENFAIHIPPHLIQLH